MLIKNDPIATITFKNGEMEIQHHSDGKLKPCIYCKTLTKERRLGIAECKECKEFEYEKCKECQFGVQKNRFVTDGEDLNDHFEYWIACAKRNDASAWHVVPPERKKCFISNQEDD